MYSPDNKFQKRNLNLFNLINSKAANKIRKKNEINNSVNTKGLILSRNNLSNKKLLMKTKVNNSYKRILLNRQLSSDNSSSIYRNTKQINTTSNISNNKKSNIKNNDSSGQILLYKQNENKYDTLYKYLVSKVNETQNLYNKNNNKLNYNIDTLTNNNQANNNGFTFSQINKKINNIINNNNKNYFQKILNYPLSPKNKSLKSMKLNNIDLDKISKHFRNIINSNKQIFIGKNNNNQNNTNNNIKIENSFIYNNTNNINLNVNIINKNIISDKINQNYITLGKINLTNNDILCNSNKKDIINSLQKNKANLNNESINLEYNYSIGNLINTTKNKPIKIRPINCNMNNNELFNLSSNFNSFNKEEKIYAEEIHFKAVKYMHEIKKYDELF